MVRLFGRPERRRRELLSAYVDGELTAHESREVEENLAASEDARNELAALQATVDLVRQLPQLDTPRSFALDAAPKKPWTLWWPSVRTTGLATSVATMLLVGLVAGDMLNVLEQARLGGDDSTGVYEYAPDVPAPAAEAVIDAPAAPEPQAAAMAMEAPQPEVAAASTEEPSPAIQQDAAQDAVIASEEAVVDYYGIDDPEDGGVTLPLMQLQIGAAIMVVVLGGATLYAVRRRRKSPL